jgi:glutathione peroxidase
MTSIYDFEATTIDGKTQSLTEFRGQVLLVVNVASRCGFTPHYAPLETLYKTYRDQGFAILGFPCNQFGRQEPGNEAEIKGFCQTNYDVTFPLFAKIEVNGPGAHPLYRYLESARPGILGTRAIKWNFTKFLVDRQGQVVGRYGPLQGMRPVEKAVPKLLAETTAAAPHFARQDQVRAPRS